MIAADGGYGTWVDAEAASGSGGRIAVIVTSGSDYGSVSMHARGGAAPAGAVAGAGTVYREAGGRRELVVENGGAATNGYTWIPAQQGGLTGTLTRVSLVISNGASVRLFAPDTVGNVFVYTNSALTLDANNLYVRSLQHPLGGGVTNSTGGLIIWLGSPKGSIFIVR